MHPDTQQLLQTHTHTGGGEGALRHSNSRDFVRTFAILMLKQRLGPGGMA